MKGEAAMKFRGNGLSEKDKVCPPKLVAWSVKVLLLTTRRDLLIRTWCLDRASDRQPFQSGLIRHRKWEKCGLSEVCSVLLYVRGSCIHKTPLR